MKIIEAVYKRLGEIFVIYADGSKKKLENLTESELKRIDSFCETHHIHADGNIIEYTGGIVPLHCIIHSKKPFTYICITTFGQTYIVTKESPQDLIQRCEKYIESCKVCREMNSNTIKYSCGEGGL
ncbi:MAG: hypothetical protein J6T10_20905 [Methanobrevibacter sp.]|nr:hypothetical protein [Methanobrevibacter sp.]